MAYSALISHKAILNKLMGKKSKENLLLNTTGEKKDKTWSISSYFQPKISGMDCGLTQAAPHKMTSEQTEMEEEEVVATRNDFKKSFLVAMFLRLLQEQLDKITNIFITTLASRLNSFIEQYVLEDQEGFIPNKDLVQNTRIPSRFCIWLLTVEGHKKQ